MKPISSINGSNTIAKPFAYTVHAILFTIVLSLCGTLDAKTKYQPNFPEQKSEHARGTAAYYRDMAEYYMGKWIVLRVSHMEWFREPEHAGDMGEMKVYTYNKGPGSYALVSVRSIEGRNMLNKFGTEAPSEGATSVKTKKLSVFYIGVWAGDSIRASRYEDVFNL